MARRPRAAATRTQATTAGTDASARIDQRLAELGGWRAEALARVRALIHEAIADVREEWKWDVPVWSSGGILCTGEAYKAAVKLTFPKGASLPDPSRLFNASLAGNARRAIDIGEGAHPDARAFKALVRAAAKANAGANAKATPRAGTRRKPA